MKVFGHKSPDTDATCSPIVYAWFLNKINIKAKAFLLGDPSREAKFVLKKFGLKAPDKLKKLNDDDEVVVMDTNNPEELPDGIEKAKIKTIIDHHKLAGLTTEEPLEVYINPVGCTATLVHQLIKKEQVKLTENMAGLLVSAILSDTLKFTSPTTTDEDKTSAGDLAKIAGIDLNKHANEMFAAKSDLTGMSAKEIAMTDSKVYEFKGKKVRISVLETTGPQNAKDMKVEICKAMKEIKQNDSLDAAFFFVIDILKNNAELFAGSNDEMKMAENAFEKRFVGDFMALPGVVSRKKQIAPKLESAYSK